MDELKAYRILKSEMKELQNFLHSARFAFNKVSKLKLFAENKEHTEYLNTIGFEIKSSEFAGFNKNSVHKLELTLNQQTLVRAISELEVYLIDIIRDIFMITKKPFQDQNKTLHFTHAQLLSLKDTSELFNQIINKECRYLSSGGFGEIIKAYKKMFNIDLLNIPPGKKRMIEYHDYRHLIIHKLGRIDFQFRKKYNIKKKKGGISISDELLETCIKDINNFAKKTHELVVNKINEYSTLSTRKLNYERQVKYRIDILNSKANLEFLNEEYEFFVNDEYEILKNILVEKNILSDSEIEISLAGTKQQIRAYYAYLKYPIKKQIIKLKRIEDLVESDCTSEDNKITKKKKKRSRTIKIDNETLELISKYLPEQPWEKYIHKKIAEKLGLKNKIVSGAISILISKGLFKQQINGRLVQDNK